jgi:hypothetical protein
MKFGLKCAILVILKAPTPLILLKSQPLLLIVNFCHRNVARTQFTAHNQQTTSCTNKVMTNQATLCHTRIQYKY